MTGKEKLRKTLQRPRSEPKNQLHYSTTCPGEQETERKYNMTLNEYQALAARTINRKLDRCQLRMHALHEMASEVGEIHGIYQKALQGHPVDRDTLKLEAGDLLWGLAEFASVMGWDLEDVAQANIDKLKRRYPDGFSAERSVHRDA